MRSLLPLMVLSACESGKGDSAEVDSRGKPGAGTIHGRVCNPSGVGWLANATVYTNLIDARGNLTETRTASSDLDGNFELADLPGDSAYTVYVQSGASILWEYDLDLPAGELVVLDPPRCFDPRRLQPAIIAGGDDDFSPWLPTFGVTDTLRIDGEDADALTAFLSDPTSLLPYNVLFIGSGCVESGVFTGGDAVSETVLTNLREFVATGGTLFVSEQAYDVVEAAWPDALDFAEDDATPDAAQLGLSGTVSAAVTDTALADYLDDDAFDVDFVADEWPIIENTAADVSVHLTGAISYRLGSATIDTPATPLLVSFNSGDGRVIFSSFRLAENGSTELYETLTYFLAEVP